MTASRTLLAAAALALAPLAAPAATLVVANKSEATVSLLDLESGRIVATLPTGDGPHEVAVAPDGRTALVANYGRQGAPGASLTVVDVAAATVVRTVDLTPYARPHGMAWLADGRRALVTAEANRALLVVDVPAGRVETAVETRAEVSHMVAVTPDGRRAFVANIGSGSVTAIDLGSRIRLRDIPTGPGAEGVCVTPDGSQVWVTNRAADTVSVIDAGSLQVVRTLEAPDFPIRAAATPDGSRVLVTCAESGDVAVFSTARRAPERRVPLPAAPGRGDGRLFGDRFGASSVPIGIVVSGDGRRAWVAHSNADVISVVDLTTWEKVGELRAGKEPDGMAWTPVACTPDRLPPAR